MHTAARTRTESARMPNTSTGRKTKSSPNPVPLRKVPRSAIWKKNGRSSLGAEMSSSKASTALSGPSGAAMSAKR